MNEAPRRKNKQTETTERANVRFPLWRKKVDNSIFRDLGTTVPNWVCRNWQFDAVFPGILKSSDPASAVAVWFEGRNYPGRVVSTHPEGRAKKVYRFYFDEALLRRLKEVFLMSHMRDLESRLRKDTQTSKFKSLFGNFWISNSTRKRKTFSSLPITDKRPHFQSCLRT
jgi:hypothetical protein